MGGNFAILNPCPKKWTDLAGTGRVRFCDVCHKHVHALDDYSPEERDQLWRETGGHVCGMVVGLSAEPVRSRRAVLASALFAAAAPLFAAAGNVRFRVKDEAGGLVQGASISLMDGGGHPARTLQTNEAGEVVFTDLPLGDLHFVARAPGFNSNPMIISVRGSKEVKVETLLRVGVGLLGEVIYSPKHPKYKGWLLY